jgi:hypothetical protein
MAIDASKVKRRLPPPLPPEEGAAGIEQVPSSAPAASPEPAPAEPVLDGRSMRVTGRVMQLNIKVTPEVKGTILRLAKERNQLVTEVIEDAIEALIQDSR